jgi:DNA polymerase III delta prime subunit
MASLVIQVFKMKNLLEKFKLGKLDQTILFYGEEGVGKSSFLQNFLDEIFPEASQDLYFLKSDGENLSLDHVRSALDFAYTSSFGAFKVLAIDSLDKLSIQGINALLKVIEEPKENLYIFLLSNSLYEVPATLKSRCLKIKIPRPSLEDFRLYTGLNEDEGLLRYLYRVFRGNITKTKFLLQDINLEKREALLAFDEDIIKTWLSNASDELQGPLIQVLLYEKFQEAKDGEEISKSFDLLQKAIPQIEKYYLNREALMSSLLQLI